MDFDDPGPEPATNRSDHDDAGPAAAAVGEPSEFDAAVVIISAERELMNTRIAALQAGVDRAYRQLIDAHADLAVASAQADADGVAAATDYVDDVKAMFERISTANVAEMTTTIEQGLSNLEAAIALIPRVVESQPFDRDRTGRDYDADGRDE